jgi:hypothetical protein
MESLRRLLGGLAVVRCTSKKEVILVGGEGTHLLLGVDIRFLSSTLDAMRFYGTDVSRRLTETLCAYAWHFLWHHEAAWTDLLYLHFTYMIRTHFLSLLLCCCWDRLAPACG